MRTSPIVTLTGADERTPIHELQRLCLMSDHVEIGLLYTFDPAERNRYPRQEWLEEATLALRKRCAVHVCGNRARSIIDTPSEWLQRAGRVQVNGRVTPAEVKRSCGFYTHIITQHNANSLDLTHVDGEGHQILVDASGGRGRLPDQWVRPDTAKPVGFAGGLGPDNLPDQLPIIAAKAIGRWWVDMEGQLRTGDWFDIAKAERCVELFDEFIGSEVAL